MDTNNEQQTDLGGQPAVINIHKETLTNTQHPKGTIHKTKLDADLAGD